MGGIGSGKKQKALYMVIDRNDNDIPLYIGTIGEVSKYTGKTQNAIRSAISHAKHRGTESQYVRLEYEDEEEL